MVRYASFCTCKITNRNYVTTHSGRNYRGCTATAQKRGISLALSPLYNNLGYLSLINARAPSDTFFSTLVILRYVR